MSYVQEAASPNVIHAGERSVIVYGSTSEHSLIRDDMTLSQSALMVGLSTCDKVRFFVTVAEVGSNWKLPHANCGAAGYTVVVLDLAHARIPENGPSSKAKAKKKSVPSDNSVRCIHPI